MKIVYYKLPYEPENIVVSTCEDAFEDSEVALLFDETDQVYRRRYKVMCSYADIRAYEMPDDEEYSLVVEDENNFTAVVPSDSIENAIQCGRFIHRELRMHEQYYDRLEDE